MRKVDDGGKKRRRKTREISFLVATNVIASWLPKRRPAGTPHARAKIWNIQNLGKIGNIMYKNCKCPSDPYKLCKLSFERREHALFASMKVCFAHIHHYYYGQHCPQHEKFVSPCV